MRLKTISMVLIMMVCILCNALTQDEILFSDTFTGADGTRPANWKIVNAPETNFWFLQDGQLCTGNGDDILSAGGYSYAIINTPNSQKWDDYVIQVSCWVYQANGNMMLIARWLDERNHYRGVLETLKGTRYLRIEKVLKGNRTPLAEVQDGVDGVSIPQMENGTSPADARTFRFIVAGSKLTLILGDEVSVEAVDTSFPTGTGGVGEQFHYAFFDDFLVQKVQEGGVTPQTVSKIPTVIQPISPAGTTSTTPGTIYRIMIGENLVEQTAKELRDQLISWGYTPIELFQKDTGYDVYLGAFLSEPEAQLAKGFLEEEGLSPRRIVSLSGAKAAEVKKQAVSPKKSYTVLAREFTDIGSADKMKKALEGDGYFPVEISSKGGNQRVSIGNFKNSEEAEKLAQALKADGYALAHVVETDMEETTPIFKPDTETDTPKGEKIFSPTDIATQQPAWTELNEKQQQEVMDILQAQDAIRKGDMVTQQIIDLKNRMDKINKVQDDLIRQIRQQAEEEDKKERQIAELILKAEKARDQKQWEEALKYCEDVKKVDPNNGRVAMIERNIRVITEKDFEGKDIIEAQEREQIKRARDKAEEWEKDQKYVEARLQWATVLSLAKPGSLDYNDANTAIGRIDGILADAELQRTKKEKSWRYTLYGIAAIMVLLVILIVMIIIRSRKHDRELFRQLQELSLKPLLELQEGKGPNALEDMTSDAQPQAAAAMQTAPPQQQPSQKPPVVTPVPVNEPEPIFAEEPEEIPEPDFIPVPEPFPVPEMETMQSNSESRESQKEEEVPVPSIDDVSFEDSLLEQPDIPVSRFPERSASIENTADEIIEPVTVSQDSVKGPAVDVDDLFSDISEESLKLEPLGKAESNSPTSSFDMVSLESLKPSPAKEEKTPAAVSPRDEITQVLTPPPEVSSGILEEVTSDINTMETPMPMEAIRVSPLPPTKQPEVVSVSSEKDSNMVYEQDFDDEETGTLPAKWKGNYNYASLIVNEETPAPNSRKCVVFEKDKGAGSAFYCCHFADTSGVIGIEFDLRCDMKNKYLLGFYIEKDEDYRYSIHTVIQYINSGKQSTKPSLRVQGKPVPYTWGEWRHIKYIVNLIDATVDGYVDGELVANGEKLASCPTSLNTISIRDNLATVGKLMIDNIKIYKA